MQAAWNPKPRLYAAARVAVALVLAGCALAVGPATAQVAAQAAAREAHPADPWEGFNRAVYRFNDSIDRAVLKPLATAWRDTVPELARRGVGNFFGNLGDGWSAVNHLLQGKAEHGLNMGMRVLTNTLFGLGGVLDPATEFGLERRSEDFGQTLGRWGVGSGPYLVLPLFGPSTLRDGLAYPLDLAVAPRPADDGARAVFTALDLVNGRAELLGASRLLDDVALDPYAFLRDAYLARRLNQVYDGEPPETPEPTPEPAERK